MPDKSFFVQVGATRDGLDPYLVAARRRGMTAVLVETPDYIRWREILGRRPYDVTLPVDRPASPDMLTAALRELTSVPALVLAGFDRYVSSAYIAAQALGARPGVQSPTFFPPYKQAQRTAITRLTPSVRQPRYALIESLTELEEATRGLTFPVVVKPDNGGGGLGVVMVDEPANLIHVRGILAGVRNYDGGAFGGWIVEEYVKGSELSVQAVARDGTAHILAFCEKLTSIEPEHEGLLYSFRESGHVAHPGTEADHTIVSFVQSCITAVGYRNGPFHIDFIRDGDALHLLEMGFRLSGMRVVELVDSVSGLNWAEEAFAAHLDTPSGIPRWSDDHRYAGQLTLQRHQQLAAAKAMMQADGVHIDVQPFTPPSHKQQSEIPDSLRSDIVRHAGAIGRVFVSAAEPKIIKELLTSLSGVTRRRLPAGNRA